MSPMFLTLQWCSWLLSLLLYFLGSELWPDYELQQAHYLLGWNSAQPVSGNGGARAEPGAFAADSATAEPAAAAELAALSDWH